MKRFGYRVTSWCLIAAVVGFICWTIALPQSHTPDISAAVSMAIRGPVQPVLAHGKFVVAYELDIFNGTSTALSILSLEAFAPGGSILLRYARNELEHNGRQFTPQAGNLRLPLMPRGRAVIFCWFDAVEPATAENVAASTAYGAGLPQTVDLTSSVLNRLLSLGAPQSGGGLPPQVHPTGQSIARHKLN